MCFTLLKTTYFSHEDPSFGSDYLEECIHFAGIAENAGRAMTFNILKEDTQKISFQSNSRQVNNPLTSNLRFDPTTTHVVIKSRQEKFSEDGTVSASPSAILYDRNYPTESSAPIIDTSDFVGRSLLMIMTQDIQHLRMTTVNTLDYHQDYLSSNPALKEFVVTSKEDTFEVIMSYNVLFPCYFT